MPALMSRRARFATNHSSIWPVGASNSQRAFFRSRLRSIGLTQYNCVSGHILSFPWAKGACDCPTNRKLLEKIHISQGAKAFNRFLLGSPVV